MSEASITGDLPTIYRGVFRDSQQELVIDDLLSFRSRDATGSFALQARHTDFLTLTEPGLSQLSRRSGNLFLAATAGLLEMEAGTLYFSTRRLFVDNDPELIQNQLAQWLEQEQRERQSSHHHLQQLESELVRRLSRA